MCLLMNMIDRGLVYLLHSNIQESVETAIVVIEHLNAHCRYLLCLLQATSLLQTNNQTFKKTKLNIVF